MRKQKKPGTNLAYVIIATFQFKSKEDRDTALPLFERQSARCLASEPGTLQFDVLTPHWEADKVMVYEVFEDHDAYVSHRDGDNSKTSFIEAKQLGIPFEITGVACTKAKLKTHFPAGRFFYGDPYRIINRIFPNRRKNPSVLSVLSSPMLHFTNH